jgi:hypothetical protein
MKAKLSIITSLFLLIILSGCNINYSESGKKINFEKDSKDLSLAKKSLQYIAESKPDSLKKMLSEDGLKKSRAEKLEWLFTNGKRIIDNNEYPNDSIITVSTTTRKSIFGEETFKEFNFPFINKNNPDSTMYFKVSIANDKILKLILSTGMRIIS